MQIKDLEKSQKGERERNNKKDSHEWNHKKVMKNRKKGQEKRGKNKEIKVDKREKLVGSMEIKRGRERKKKSENLLISTGRERKG